MFLFIFKSKTASEARAQTPLPPRGGRCFSQSPLVNQKKKKGELGVRGKKKILMV